VTGGPSFEVGQTADENLNVALGALLPSLGSWLSSKVGGVDVVEVQTAGLGADEVLGSRRGQRAASGLLSGTRIGAGKQINDRTYLGVNLGLCELGRRVDESGFSLDALKFDLDAVGNIWETLGWKVDYRLNREWTASLGVEPGTSARLCGQTNATTIVQAPKQLGFDFFRRWEF
jgi:hypothetical protein